MSATIGLGTLVYYTYAAAGRGHRLVVEPGYITRVRDEQAGIVDLRLWPSGRELRHVHRCWCAGELASLERWAVLPQPPSSPPLPPTRKAKQ